MTTIKEKMKAAFDTERFDPDEGYDRLCDRCDKEFKRGQMVYIGSYRPDEGSSHYCYICARNELDAELALMEDNE